ncbi:molybdate ABC transporter substrate-binding protein [Phenylobacterium sp.]|jgi:molybdate transport system substrate-binding protein|uniref:molybdate ABC transporter substrate-binding protein n=1 Tax=Phenylobacterium sp. TaxID=1871053 RepID=UPI0037836006
MSSRRAVLQSSLAALVAPSAASAQAVPTVAAASDLFEALPPVAAAFREATGRQVRLSFGPTEAFARQIERGVGGYQLFLAADEAYVGRLQRLGKAQDAGALYGVGRIGLFTPAGSKVRGDGRLRDLPSAIRDGRLGRLLILNPAADPYGRATREALMRTQAWMPMQRQLVLAETLPQAAQLAISGTVQAAILPQTLARTPKVRTAGGFSLIPEEWHPPLRQRAVLLKGAGPTAEAFYRYLRSPVAREILIGWGFTLPGGR